MGRPPTHTVDELLDEAAALFAAGGERAVTTMELSRRTGASNGSIYHRFPERASLLAALWMRTASRFQSSYFDVLGDPPTAEGIVTAGVWVIRWCRQHLAEAIVLQAGVRAFAPDDWPEAARREHDELDRALQQRIRGVLTVVGERTGLPRDQIAFAMLDLPLAAVRRHLLAGEAPPSRSAELVRSLTETLLAT